MRKEKKAALSLPRTDSAKFNRIDAAAMVVGAILLLYYLYISFNGINIIDESFYHCIPMRILNGDRFFIDEWHVSQLAAVPVLLPYKLFTLITGGTDGIVLYFRILFIVCHFLISGFIYFHVREYGWAGLVAAAMYCAYVPYNCPTLSYNTMCIMALAAVGVLLFLKKENKTFELVLSGVIFSVAVLCEPLLFFFYFIYSLLALARFVALKKGYELFETYDFILNVGTWLRIFAGVIGSFFVFVCYLMTMTTPKALIEIIPDLFLDPEYNFSLSGGNVIDFDKYEVVVDTFTPVVLILCAAVVLCILLDRKKIHRNSAVIVSVIAASAAYLVSFHVNFSDYVNWKTSCYYFFNFYRSLPVLVIGAVCWKYTKRRDIRLFSFWLFGLFSAVFIDIASDWSTALISVVAVIPSVLMIFTLLGEIWADPGAKPHFSASMKRKSGKTEKLAVKAALPVLIAIMLLCESSWLIFSEKHYAEIKNGGYEVSSSVVLDAGPLKGIRTSSYIGETYSQILRDLDIIREQGRNERVYVMGLNSWYYLYLDMPMGTYSTWYEEFLDIEDTSRQLRYYENQPEMQSGYIYLPKTGTYCSAQSIYGGELAKSKLAFLDRYYDYTVISESAVGYVIRILR